MRLFRQSPVATGAEAIAHLATTWLALVCAGFAIWYILAVYRLAPPLQPLMGLTGLVIIAANLGLSIARIYLRGRGSRIVKEHDFLICPQCRFDLRGLSDPGRCPECGRTYSKNDLERTWINAYDMLPLSNDAAGDL